MKIAVVGSINLDMIVHAERIPYKGETIRGKYIDYQPGGKGANQAVAIAKLGEEVTMFGCIGNDADGKKMIANMSEQGVRTDYIQILDGVQTGRAMITIGESDNSIVVIAGANDEVSVSYIEKYKDKILESDIILLQNEIPKETVEYVISLCSRHEKIIVWNPAPAREINQKLLDMVTYITPNEHEAKAIFGDKIQHMHELIRLYPDKLIVTRGSKGISSYINGEDVSIPAIDVEVKDTTGAGDILNGAFCVGLSKGLEEKEALEFANAAAGISVQKFGAQSGMPQMEDVRQALKTYRIGIKEV